MGRTEVHFRHHRNHHTRLLLREDARYEQDKNGSGCISTVIRFHESWVAGILQVFEFLYRERECTFTRHGRGRNHTLDEACTADRNFVLYF